MFNFFYQQRTYNLTIMDFKDSEHYASYPAFPSQAYYLFQDTTEIKLLNKKNIYARLRSNKTIDEIVNKYPSIASRLNMMLSIQLLQNETVLMGMASMLFYVMMRLLKVPLSAIARKMSISLDQQ